MTDLSHTQLTLPAENPRPRLGLLGLYVAGVMLLGLWTVISPQVPTGYVSLAPGPSPDAEKLTKIDARTYSSQGSFHITTALVSSGAVSLSEFVHDSFQDDITLVDKTLVYPPSLTAKQAEQQHAAEMTQSQQSAAIAALKELGLPVASDGALINDISRKGSEPADLKAGDIVKAIDSHPVLKAADIRDVLRSKQAGDVVQVQLDRGGMTRTVSVKTITIKSAPGQARLGILTSNDLQLPFKISIDAQQIGGPSAGLVFAVSIYDLLEPSDLTGGKVIAGTGTIDDEGKVGPIGAVEQKIKGAEKINAKVFLVPRDELQRAKAALKTDMVLIPIDTLHQAIAELRKLR
ncbi:MAG: PDZ domain-containing protein [Actinomycetota bacterium]|nr:PDZ domain-containing protein [Actinomycetota bacterium]